MLLASHRLISCSVDHCFPDAHSHGASCFLSLSSDSLSCCQPFLPQASGEDEEGAQQHEESVPSICSPCRPLPVLRLSFANLTNISPQPLLARLLSSPNRRSDIGNTGNMRYGSWDVLLFPHGSKTPMQEFRTQCFVTRDNGVDHTADLGALC